MDEHVRYAQSLASLRGDGRALRRRIELDARRPVQTLLLVEDDPLTRALIATTLSPETYEIIQVGTVHEGLAALEAGAPSIVILDLGLPDGSGIEFCRRAKRLEPEAPPVIVLTGSIRPSDRDAAVAAGADRFIEKPFSPLHLLQIIEELVC